MNQILLVNVNAFLFSFLFILMKNYINWPDCGCDSWASWDRFTSLSKDRTQVKAMTSKSPYSIFSLHYLVSSREITWPDFLFVVSHHSVASWNGDYRCLLPRHFIPPSSKYWKLRKSKMCHQEGMARAIFEILCILHYLAGDVSVLDYLLQTVAYCVSRVWGY